MEALKIILIILAIFFGIFLLLSSDQEIARFFNSLAGKREARENIFENVILTLDSRNVFSNAKFHADEKVNVNDIVPIPGSPNLFYAVAGGAVYYSNDFGTNWYPVKGKNENIFFYRLFVNNQRPNEISALATENGKVALYKTVNGFISLEKIYDIQTNIFNDIAKGRNISIMLPVDGRIIFGTSE